MLGLFVVQRYHDGSVPGWNRTSCSYQTHGYMPNNHYTPWLVVLWWQGTQKVYRAQEHWRRQVQNLDCYAFLLSCSLGIWWHHQRRKCIEIIWPADAAEMRRNAKREESTRLVILYNKLGLGILGRWCTKDLGKCRGPVVFPNYRAKSRRIKVTPRHGTKLTL